MIVIARWTMLHLGTVNGQHKLQCQLYIYTHTHVKDKELTTLLCKQSLWHMFLFKLLKSSVLSRFMCLQGKNVSAVWRRMERFYGASPACNCFPMELYLGINCALEEIPPRVCCVPNALTACLRYFCDPKGLREVFVQVNST